MLVLMTPSTDLAVLLTYHKTKCICTSAYLQYFSNCFLGCGAVFRIIPVVCVSSPRLCCVVLVLFVMFFEYPLIVERSGCAHLKFKIKIDYSYFCE